MDRPDEERRSVLGQLDLHGPGWNVTEAFDDGAALYGATDAVLDVNA